MVRIFHTADLHLDSPFVGLSVSNADAAREDQRQVFCRMVSYAKENGIDLFLIAGDLFDTKYITARTKQVIIEALASLSCPVIIAPGNHDPYSSTPFYRSAELPENVTVLSSEEMQVIDLDDIGVSVCGYAFVNDRLDDSPVRTFSAMAEGIRARSKNKLVLCAHADINAPLSKYAPVSVADIERCGFDYAALGHVHCPPSIDSDKVLIRYSGFPYGRAFDELGEGGAYVVTLDDERGNVAERVIFSEHRFLREALDVSGAENMEGVERMIRDRIASSSYKNETSLRIELVGTLPLDCVINEKTLEKQTYGLRMLSVKNKTVPIPDSLSLKNDPTLRGELYRTLLPMLESEDADERRRAAAALNIGLYAIEGRKISDLLGEDGSGGRE